MGFGLFGEAAFSNAHVCVDNYVNDHLKLIRTIDSEQRITCSPYIFRLHWQVNRRTVWLMHTARTQTNHLGELF